MRLLLDTHVVLWWLDDPARLSHAARQVLADAENTVFVSAVTAWEIAIKRSSGKLTVNANLEAVLATLGLRVAVDHGKSCLDDGITPPDSPRSLRPPARCPGDRRRGDHRDPRRQHSEIRSPLNTLVTTFPHPAPAPGPAPKPESTHFRSSQRNVKIWRTSCPLIGMSAQLSGHF